MSRPLIPGYRYLIWDGSDPMSIEEIEIIEKSDKAIKIKRHGKSFGQIAWESRVEFSKRYEIYEDLGPAETEDVKVGLTD